MNDDVCKCCGKSLIVPADPKNPTQLNTMLGHYIEDNKVVCIECHDGKCSRKKEGCEPSLASHGNSVICAREKGDGHGEILDRR